MLSPPTGPGWVYVLTCPDFPGCSKIGGTSRTATHRKRELVREYGTSEGFTVAGRPRPVADWFAVEQAAHRMLSDRRVPRSELFRVSPREARRVVRICAAAYARPWGLSAWLRRRMLAPSRVARPWGYSRRRRPTNWLPLLLVLSIAAGAIVEAKPGAPAWLPASVVRVVYLLERL